MVKLFRRVQLTIE